MNFFLLLNTKEECCNQTVSDSILCQVEEVNGGQQLFGSKHSSKYIFCVKKKKEIHTGLEQLEGE